MIKAIAKSQGIKDNAINIDATVPYDVIAAELGLSAEDLQRYWLKEGKKKYTRSLLPKWSHADSLLLLNEIESTEEEDENCVNFEQIYQKSFQGKVVDWKHLREHYNRLRRVVPYYLLKDLKTAVLVAKKELKRKMEQGDEDSEEKTEEANS